jgi:hypothetical protein
LDRLICAIQRSLAGSDPSMHGDTEIGIVLDQLSVLGPDRRMAGIGPVRQASLNGTAQARSVASWLVASMRLREYRDGRT